MKILITALLAVPLVASAGVTVSKPAVNSQVTSPFQISASSSSCQNLPTKSMGYSLDTGPDAPIVKGKVIYGTVPAGPGLHTLHAKAWSSTTKVCVTDVKFTVVAPIVKVAPALTWPVPASVVAGTALTSEQLDASSNVPGTFTYIPPVGTVVEANQTLTANFVPADTVHYTDGSVSISLIVTPKSAVPPNAVVVSDLQDASNWEDQHDPATSGTSAGVDTQQVTPSLSGHSREFQMNYTSSGGHLFHVSFADQVSATNFIYDTYLYISGSSAGIANIEMDMNQVLDPSHVVIYGVQCDGYSGTWDYTTVAHPHWLHSSQKCNPRSWTTDTWHHVKMSYSRDSIGDVTYKSVWFDEVEYPINETVNSLFSLKWSQVELLNFQVDGLGASGSATVYMDNTTVYSW